MNETNIIKDEIAHLKPRKKCDRLSELSALVRITGSLHLRKGGFDLAMASANPAVARKTLVLLKDLFDIDTELVTEAPSPRHRKPNYIITIPAQTGLVFALKKSHILDEESSLTRGIPFTIFKDTCCMAAYMRGVFLAAGSLNLTEHGYHLEVATANATLAEDLLTLMEELGFPARLNERNKDFAVYLTAADSIIDFLALIGAHSTVMDLENLRILRTLKSEVNRVVNAETANLKKAAKASVSQVNDIRLIEKRLGLQRLSPALRDVARARLKKPSATTTELGATFHPALTKSAVNHRLRRLHELAVKLSR